MVRGCRYTKLIDFRYRYNRYRYHKNAIINKDISPLVDIVLLVAVRASPPHCRNNVISFIASALLPSAQFLDSTL